MKRETLVQRLCGFTDAELRAELRRRDRGDEDDLFANTEVAFCEDCQRFSYGGTDDKPEGICAAGKKMRFRVPYPGPHDPFGHYRVGCRERVAKLDAEEVRRFDVQPPAYITRFVSLNQETWHAVNHDSDEWAQGENMSQRVPDDMPGAVPRKIDGYWHWVLVRKEAVR